MPLARTYTFLVLGQETADQTDRGTDLATTTTRDFYTSFRIRATSREAAQAHLRSTPEWDALANARIDEVQDEGIAWWGWWERQPRVLGRVGRAYFEGLG